METQIKIKVNGQVIILADVPPTYDWGYDIEPGHGYDQWRNVCTGETWNVDGSIAHVCYNADIAEAPGNEISILAPTHPAGKEDTPNQVDCWRRNDFITHTIVDTIDDEENQNQIICWDSRGDSVFMVVHEEGVGYVQSCGTAAVAVAEYTGKNIIKCHGGQYTITRKGYTWNVKAENMENSS